MNDFLFGIYPYIAGTIFLVGSWLRFDREQYTWKADSSQFLNNDKMRLASNLFHIGIIAIFFGHFFGMLTPHSVFLALGISDLAHQKIAIVAGIIFGGICLVGGTMLIKRRLKDPRIVAAGRKRDLLVIGWLLATLIVGLLSTLVSMSHVSHGDASTMIALTSYVQSVATLQADPALLADVNPIFKLHMLLGMTVFLIFPFTRLVHIWSVPLTYLRRAYQIVRTKRIAAR